MLAIIRNPLNSWSAIFVGFLLFLLSLLTFFALSAQITTWWFLNSLTLQIQCIHHLALFWLPLFIVWICCVSIFLLWHNFGCLSFGVLFILPIHMNTFDRLLYKSKYWISEPIHSKVFGVLWFNGWTFLFFVQSDFFSSTLNKLTLENMEHREWAENWTKIFVSIQYSVAPWPKS